MKIGIDCRLINKIQNTGISRYTEFLIDYYLSRLEEKNIYLITNDLDFIHLNCNIVHTKLKPFNIWHFIFFSNFIKSLDLNLFHSPFYSGFFKKIGNLKTIVTVHDLMYQLLDNYFNTNQIINSFKVFYINFIVKRSLVIADNIISVSIKTQDDVFNVFGLESDHIPEDSEIKQGADYSILEMHGLENKNFYFYCGNSRPHKNIDFVVNIFNNNPNLPPLVLAGKGHLTSKNVIATGIVSDEELKALYGSCLAFIFPSRYEGFGLPILEALRCGSFVIASNIPAFLEFNSKNILFFELDNKKDFTKALVKTMNQEYLQEESFFDYYEKKRIYKLNDMLIKNLMNLTRWV